MKKPENGTYGSYYQRYVESVENPILSLENSLNSFEIIKKHWVQHENYAYAPNKWTVKALFTHIVDTERIMSYRFLRVVRGDKTELPGFDENLFAENSLENNIGFEETIEDLILVRKATLSLFKNTNDKFLDNQTIASEKPVSARALIFITAGHEKHHFSILKERYNLSI